MASSRKHHRRGRKSSRKYRGGYAANYPEIYSTEGSGQLPAAADASSYNDAGSWMLKTVGNVNTQFDNAFNQSNSTSSNGAIVGLQGQVAGRRTRRRVGGAFGNAPVGPLQSSSTQHSFGKAPVGPLQSSSIHHSFGKAPVGPLQSNKFKGGKKSRKHHRKSNKGGNIGSILSKAAVPLSILALQQTYNKKSKKGGNIGGILSEAAVPLSILALQQTYNKKSKKGGNIGGILSEAAVPLSILALQQSYKKKRQ
jgi:hypothetical protein